MKINHSKEVIKILDDELAYWKQRATKEGLEDSIYYDGAINEINHMKNSADEITRDLLLEKYHAVKNRKIDTKIYNIMNITKKRDEFRMQAFVSIGKKITKLLDN